MQVTLGRVQSVWLERKGCGGHGLVPSAHRDEGVGASGVSCNSKPSGSGSEQQGCVEV